MIGFRLDAQNWNVKFVSLRQYLEKVNTGNLAYAAEKLNVNAAKAEVIAARVFNDPELSVSYANNQDWKLQMGQNVEVGLSQAVTLGKRRAGINLSKSQSELTEALLADYYRNLRADATNAYYEVLKQKQLYEVKKNSYQSMSQLAKSDSLRCATGKIMEVEATQSKLEAGIMWNEMLQAEADLHKASLALTQMMGVAVSDTLYLPVGELQHTERLFVLDELLTFAADQRADVVAALKNTEMANRAVALARKEKLPDLNFSLALGHNYRVRNEEAPSPNFNAITAGVSFPLTFSALNKGAVNAAKFRAQQARILYEDARRQVQTEVMQSYHQYQSLCTQSANYSKGLLAEAQEVLKGKKYSYNRGEASLLELLTAQRTFNEVQAQYIETLYSYNVSLVELERTAGLWDME